jgi:branched-chain amino acid transport system permease protein
MFGEPVFSDAIIFASLLTLLSIGLTLTYLTTRVPNFAHGSFATIGIYVALTVNKILGMNIYYNLPISFLLVGLIALTQYLFVLRPLLRRGSSIATLMISTIAVDLMLSAGLNIYADYVTRAFKVTSRYFYLKGADFKIASQSGLLLIAPLLTASIVVILHVVLTRTKFGVAMRATIENPSLAGTFGVNCDLVYCVSWFLAGGLAGMAGGLLPLWFISNPDTGTFMLISIFAASITGGLLSIYGAIIGGYLMGFAEVLVTWGLARMLGTWVVPYRPAIPLLAMVVTLLLAPRGVTGLALRFKGPLRLTRRGVT